MNEQNKDSLENFFRERAQSHNLEFYEGDWLKLEKQLDREMPVAFTFLSFLKRYWTIPLLLLIIPIGWISYNYNNEGSDRNDSKAPAVQEKFFDEEINNTDDPANVSTTSDETINQTPTIGPLLASKREVGEKYNTSKSDQDDGNIESGNFNKILETNSEVTNTKYINNEEINSNKIGQVVFEEGAQSGIKIKAKGLLFLSAMPPTFKIYNGSLEKPEVVAAENEVIPLQSKTSYLKVGVGYSPDFSTVGIGNFVPPGSRWTVILEYGFLNRLAINTGVVLVDNKYEAYGEDYHAPARYWKKGIVAEEAYGVCKMIDIPLNLRYNFLSIGKNSVFASAGASTYFVLKEDYYFHYEQDDPDLPDHWGTDKTTIYPFGIINLSVGYEYEFGRRSGLQIEPFIKIPTTGIGWGNVDLHTLGVYFLYKYKL